MGRWRRLLVAAVSLAALLCTYAPGFTVSPVAAAQPPNIVVLMVDDLGMMDDRMLSVLPTINSTFLQHGARFTDYIGNNPMCCPGRTNFLTGQFSHHTGVTVNDARLFDPRESIATELQGVGYETFIAGKYLNQTELLDNKMPPGWTKAFVSSGGYWGATFWLNGEAVTDPTSYSTDVATPYATHWIDQARAQDPIFLLLTPFAPHGINTDGSISPLEASPPDRYLNDPRCLSLAPWKPPNYAEADVSDKPAYVRRSRANFPNGWPLARTCEAMLAVDDQFAEVQAAMAAAGRTNTMYVFTSDNGMAYGAHGLNSKQAPYSTPMPLFIRWDAGIGSSAAHTIATTVSNVDMAPTFCALAGCQMGPYPDGFGVDGVSFASVLRGTSTATGRQYVLEESPGQVLASVPRWYGVRTTNENALGRWVYTEYETGECELYNLVADPWELTNRCDSQSSPYPSVRAQLANALHFMRHDAPGSQCTSTCYVDAFSGDDTYGGASPRHAKQHIQTAIDAVNPGGVVRVLPGDYRERATNRSPSTRAGSYNFGLFVTASKPGITIVGVDALDHPITDATAIQADVTTIGDANFGPVGVYVDAANTTFQGLRIKGNLDPVTKVQHNGRTFEVVADGFALRDSATNVPGRGSIWLDDPNGVIGNYHIANNMFSDGTSIHISSHTGTTGYASNREIKSNTFALGGTAQPAIDFDGKAGSGAAEPFDGQVGGATIVNNSFSGGSGTYIRSRGDVVDAEFDWSSWFSNNSFDAAVMVGPNPLGGDLTGYTSTCGSFSCPTLEIATTIQRQIDHAQPGDTVYVRAGTYHESPAITKSVTLNSATGRAGTTIALGTGPTPLGALFIEANNVTVDGFTILGRDGTTRQPADSNILVAAGLHSVTIQNSRLRVGEVNGAPTNDHDGVGILTTNTTAPNQFVDTLTIRNNLFQPINGSAFRAWHVRSGVTNLTITGNTVTGTFDVTAMAQASTGVVSNNTIVGSGSSASIGVLGSPDLIADGQTTFQGNDISGTNTGIVVAEANNVTITNNLIHDVGNGVVLSDLGDFSADLVGPSVHVNNNSITGVSGNLLTNAYADPVDASGNWWGTKVETNIAGGLQGDVDFTPYLDLGADTDAAQDFQGNHGTVHVTALGRQTGSEKRLREALDLVDPSGTIVVGPGAFTGDITVAKSVTLQGAHFADPVNGRTVGDASESLINGTITLAAPDITVDGFSVSDSVSSNEDPAYGVVVLSAGSGATISHDVLDGITSAGPGMNAEAISLQGGPDDVTITDNRIANVSGDGRGGGIVVGDAGGSNGSSDIDIERNVINGISSAMGAFGVVTNNSYDTELSIRNNAISNVIGDQVHAIAFNGPASEADVRGNSFANLNAGSHDPVAVWFGDNDDALDDAIVRRNSLDIGQSGYGIAAGNASVGSVDGACNWWGDQSGPSGTGVGAGSKVSLNVSFDRWLTSSDLGGSCSAIDVGTAAPNALGTEGQTLSTGGTFATESGAPPTISANNPVGTFTDNHDGTWTWTYDTTDNVPSTTITVRATDQNGSRATDRFVARAVNVAPSATFGASGSVLFGTSFDLSLTNVTDPSPADMSPPPSFQFAFDCGDGSGLSAPGGSFTATCVAPANPGDITVQGRVVDKDGGARTYSLTVHVTQPAISLTPATVDYGTVSTGGSPTKKFTVTNVGTAPLTVHDTALSGTDSGQYVITGDGCSGAPLAVNASCTISVTFAPTTDGHKTASLVIDSDDPHLPSASSSLSGTRAQLGTIRIRLVTHPGTVVSPFAFTGTSGIQPFQLPTNGSLGRQFEIPAPGSYTITENASARWPLIGITCTSSQTIDLAQRSVTIQIAVGQTVDCTFVNTRRAPDEAIAIGPNGPYKGNDVYSSVPIDRQRARQIVAPGTFKNFWVVLQNDSLDPDTFTLAASYTGSNMFQVRIWRANLDVTAQVLAGRYTLKGLAPGEQLKLRVTVRALATAPLTAAGTVDLLMSSVTGPGAVDVVEAIVSAQ